MKCPLENFFPSLQIGKVPWETFGWSTAPRYKTPNIFSLKSSDRRSVRGNLRFVDFPSQAGCREIIVSRSKVYVPSCHRDVHGCCSAPRLMRTSARAKTNHHVTADTLYLFPEQSPETSRTKVWQKLAESKEIRFPSTGETPSKSFLCFSFKVPSQSPDSEPK